MHATLRAPRQFGHCTPTTLRTFQEQHAYWHEKWLVDRCSTLLPILPPNEDGGGGESQVRHSSCPGSPWARAKTFGVALAGPRSYPGEEVTDPWVGDGRRETDASDIRRALGLYRAAGAILAASLLAAALI